MTANTPKITVTLYGNRGEHPVTFPARWTICPACDGCATDRGASVESDGGGFTSSEWSSLDLEFREGYMAGHYDRPCEPCDGLGRILVVDGDKITGRWQRKLLAEHARQEQDSREFDALCAAERRMGA